MPWSLGSEVHVDHLHARENVHIDGDPIALSSLTENLTGVAHGLGVGAMHYDASNNVVTFSTTGQPIRQLAAADGVATLHNIWYNATTGELVCGPSESVTHTTVLFPPTGFYGTVTVNHTHQRTGTATFELRKSESGTAMPNVNAQTSVSLSRGTSTTYTIAEADRQETWFFVFTSIPSNRSVDILTVQNGSFVFEGSGRTISPDAEQYENGSFVINFSLSD